jgi:hypothetical protein
MVDKGLSSFIPGQVHEAHRPFASSGWEVAALMYAVALWLSLIGDLVYGFSLSFHVGLQGLFADGPWLLVGAAVSVVAVTLVTRLQGPHADHLGRQLLDAALTLFFLLGLLAVVIGTIGFFYAFTDSGFGPLVYDLFLHLTDIAVGVLVAVWALGEIGALGRHGPEPANLEPAIPAQDLSEAAEAGKAAAASPATPYSPPPTMPPFAPPPAPPTTTLPTAPPPVPPSTPSA